MGFESTPSVDKKSMWWQRSSGKATRSRSATQMVAKKIIYNVGVCATCWGCL